MSNDREPITELDLVAYVDDQLDPTRRVEVEAHLARQPSAAARVMADLQARDLLRLNPGKFDPSPPKETMHAARRLERALIAAILPRWAGMVAGVVLLLVAAWFVGTESGSVFSPVTPASAGSIGFLDEAVMSHRAALARARMQSQLEVTVLDPKEIREETRIAVPSLPSAWRIRDVQVFPSDEGLSLQISLDAGTNEALSLFAIHRPVSGFAKPSLVQIRGDTIAYWVEGEMSYALIGSLTTDELKRVAEDLADNPIL